MPVFQDFILRRKGLVKALTTDLDAFLESCDPERESLFLSVEFDSESRNVGWGVGIPSRDVPPRLQGIPPGVSFNREDRISLSDWLLKIAEKCDTWLKSAAVAHPGIHLDIPARDRLLTKINEYPTVSRDVGENLHSIFGLNQSMTSDKITGQDKSENEECNICTGAKDSTFWVSCDTCGDWYHGDCVHVTPTMAEKRDTYKCPYCRIAW